jgi:hypothetical protein
MPNNYKSTSISTESWCRSSGVHIENELGQVPVISFTEEEVLVINGKKLILGGSLLQENMGDPSKQFDLLNPETDTVIGSATYMDIYIMLYSMYKKLALERDASSV